MRWVRRAREDSVNTSRARGVFSLVLGVVVLTAAPRAQEPLPFRDPSLPVDARVADLVSRLTLEEKVGQMMNASPAVPRLGIPAYEWWNESLHGVARAGRATVFPQAIGLAATFDPVLIERIADAISTEARAKHHAAARAGNYDRYRGLTFWTPNINIFRDPRWGRGQETYGEDPYLTGQLGAAFVRGLQGHDATFLKAAACAKHFAVHSGPEAERHRFDAQVSKRDLAETYLPAFKTLVGAGVEAVMCAYNRVNGEPACGSEFLLRDTLRGEWGFKGHVVSDCGAVYDMDAFHKVTANRTESSLKAVRAGTNLTCGTEYKTLIDAVRAGQMAEKEIDASLAILLRTRVRLGLFDPEGARPYAATPVEVVGNDTHRGLARQAAARSIVLLKNAGGVLPLSKQARRILVTGPIAADNAVLLGNYHGYSAHLTTVLEGIVAAVSETTMIDYRPGTLLDRESPSRSESQAGQGRNADVTIAVLGISPLLEGEEGDSIASPARGDRVDIGLPQNQRDLLKALRAGSRRLVVVLCGGSPIAAPEVQELADAVLFAWYPGQEGGHALADVLFGDVSPSGRLPVTFPASVEQLPPFEDYRMTGRTYRYMTQEPLYPFGFGLSYSTFTYELVDAPREMTRGGAGRVRIRLTNTGTRPAADVVQLYVTGPGAGERRPLFALRAFEPVHLTAGESHVVELPLTAAMFARVDEDGREVVDAGAHAIVIGSASPGARAVALGAPEPVRAAIDIR
jgi:beta-glucosidase